MDEKYFYCIYQITNNINNKIYIGQHKYPASQQDPLENYDGSGKLIRAAYAKYSKENFTKTVLESNIETQEEANAREIFKIQEALHTVGKSNMYNISLGGNGGDLGEEVNNNRRASLLEFYSTHKNARKGVPMSLEARKKMSEASKNKPKPWLSGRPRTDREIQASLLHSKRLEGRCWYNNGFTETLSEDCPEGFTKGRLSKGKMFFNNGVIEVRSKECPEGFTKGKLPDKTSLENQKHWFTDGKINKLSINCPEGFYPGKTQKKHCKKNLNRKSLKGYKKFTNGTVTITALECPEGFKPGFAYSSKVKAVHENKVGNKFYTDGNVTVFKKECPEGFWEGKTLSDKQKQKGSKWYTNGSINVRRYECPEGFYEGRCKIKS